MFINNLHLLVSIRNGLKFTTIEYNSNRSEISLVNSINKTGRGYKSHGILVSTMFVDPKFKFLEDKVARTRLNTANARNNMPEVELQIKVIKKRTREHHSNLLFPRFTQWMAI